MNQLKLSLAVAGAVAVVGGATVLSAAPASATPVPHHAVVVHHAAHRAAHHRHLRHRGPSSVDCVADCRIRPAQVTVPESLAADALTANSYVRAGTPSGWLGTLIPVGAPSVSPSPPPGLIPVGAPPLPLSRFGQ